MRVEVESPADRAVAEPPLHDVRLYPGLEQERGAGVAQPVKRDPSDLGLRDQTDKHSLDYPKPHRTPQRLREDQTVIDIVEPSRQLLLGLQAFVLPKKGQRLSGQIEDAGLLRLCRTEFWFATAQELSLDSQRARRQIDICPPPTR